MVQPLETIFALAQANIRLGLKLTETWRESGRKLLELSGRGASEVADETRAALTTGLSGKEGVSVNKFNSHLQDLFSEVETVRVAAAAQVEEAVGDWRKNLGNAVSVDPNAAFETLMKPWLVLATPATPWPVPKRADDGSKPAQQGRK
ncbi:hypothetical protein [Sphingobium sp. D43FB]|uniref:hypothetical protein n=1 Tax=Sphingobium sp. D43FB TaxID=2017595 RepID=UPI000BB5846E|nr:hypothetical protein [Sphingobium sp. D43FB]PBN42261.1 hypothetical protein SxD43FB_17215 [Sphingobium sp. D43FB]